METPQIAKTDDLSNSKNSNFLIIVITVNLVFGLILAFLIFLLWDKTNKLQDNFQGSVDSLEESVSGFEVDLQEISGRLAPLEQCIDSDGGKDYSVNGAVKVQQYNSNGTLASTSDVSDDCIDQVVGGVSRKVLREYFCDPNGKVQYDYYTCPNGCNAGVCLP